MMLWPPYSISKKKTKMPKKSPNWRFPRRKSLFRGKMSKLRIGTAGIPASTKPRSTANAAKRVAELGLRHMEIEFVRGVNMKEDTAQEIRALAEEHDISLAVHAPYYVNLNSAEPEKITASKERIIQAARAGAWAGAKSVTFHAAYYHADDPEDVYDRV